MFVAKLTVRQSFVRQRNPNPNPNPNLVGLSSISAWTGFLLVSVPGSFSSLDLNPELLWVVTPGTNL